MTIDEAVAKAEPDMAARLVRLQDQQLLLMIESGMRADDAAEFIHEQRAQFQAELSQFLAKVRQGFIDFDEPDEQD